MYLYYAFVPRSGVIRENSKKTVSERFGVLMDIEVLFLAHLSGLE